MAILAVTYAAGVAIGFPGTAFGLPVALGFLLGAWGLLRRDAPSKATALVLAAFFALGGAARSIAEARVQRSSLRAVFDHLGSQARDAPHWVEGRLRREAEERLDDSVLLLDVSRLSIEGRWEEARGGLRVVVRGMALHRRGLSRLAPGDRLRMWVTLRSPEGFGNPGAFDFESYLERSVITLMGSVKSALLVERVQRGPKWQGVGGRIRGSVRERLAVVYRDRPEDDEVLGVVLALVIGDRTRVPGWTEKLYQRAGTFHVMAISGAHVGIVAWILFQGLRWLGWGQQPALLCLFFWLPCYAGICGGRPSVVRASIMGLTLVSARLLSLETPVLNALALSALVLLCLNPLELFDPGFQLSFGATTTLILLAGPLERLLRPRLGWLGAGLAVSIAAHVGVIPILAHSFHRLSPAALVANLVAMPLAAGVMVAGFATVALAPIPWCADALGGLAALCVQGLTSSSRLAVALPGGSLRVPPPGMLWLAMYALALFFVLLARGRWRRAGACVLALLIVLLAARPSAPTPSYLRLTVLDVGHGDALLVEIPGNHRLLVDAGGAYSRTFDMGERVVVPFLLDHGVRSLDALVVTHADFDHLGGALEVISELRVGALWEGEPAWERSAYRRLRRLAAQRGVPVRRLRSGEDFAVGRAFVEVLSAGGAPGRSRQGGNDSSVVLRLRHGTGSVLLTGDAERALEESLVGSGRSLQATILKVAHHGSQSSTTPGFLDAVSPEVAVVSAGSGRQGLPSELVLERLRRRGIRVVRTDRDGAIRISLSSDGRVFVESFLRGPWRKRSFVWLPARALPFPRDSTVRASDPEQRDGLPRDGSGR